MPHPPLPPTRRDPLVEVLHGVEVPDPYRWLEDNDDPEVQAWVDERNAHTDAWIADRPVVERLRATFERLWRVPDARPPEPCSHSDVELFQTKGADQDKWVLHVRLDPSRPDDTKVVLDPNTWPEDDELAWFLPSPDGTLLAYGIAHGGDENPQGRILDLRTLVELPDRFCGWKVHGVGWVPDGSGLFYVCKPLEGEVPPHEHHYWQRARFHPLGSDGSGDPITHCDPDVKERYHWSVPSEDGRHVAHHAASFDKMRVHLQRWPDGPKVPLMEGYDASYYVDVLDDRFVVRTDWGASRYRVMLGHVDRPEREHWVELIPEHPTDLLESVTAVDGRLVVGWVHDATSRLTLHRMDGSLDHELVLPEPGTASVGGHFGKGPIRVSFQSYTHPAVLYRYDPDGRVLSELWRSPIPIDPSRMHTEQVWVTSRDGTPVPMFLVRDRDARPTGDHPVWLTGYGGFNVSRRPQFSSLYATWIASGGGLAIPNLRGGGEYGQAWHEAGMRERKQNVFDDFLAAADWLIDQGWTSPDRLGISGGSNGGLLVAAVMTQRPDRFRAVLCQVPLTDMLRFHRFGIANIWSDEYGNAEDPEMFPHLLAYSPVHNVRPGVRWPALLVVASANDARTDPVHARKLYAAVEGSGPADPERPLLLRIDPSSGHLGPPTIAQLAAQSARNLGFLMDQLGMEG